MAKTKQEKQKIYQQYNDILDNYQTFILLDTNALKTSAIEIFKNKLGEKRSKYLLIKNTLFSKALKEKRPEIELGKIEGSTGALFTQGDPSEVLKDLMTFLNENKTASVRTALIEGTIADKSMVEAIAKLPGKEQMIAMTIGAIKSPLYGFVNVLAGVQRNFLYTLKAIEATK